MTDFLNYVLNGVLIGQLYALLFSNVQRAAIARELLGVRAAQPFYVCAANRDEVERSLHLAGARGFIVDYDAHSASYTSAGHIGLM